MTCASVTRQYMLLQELTDLKERCRKQGLLEQELQQRENRISQLQHTLTAVEVGLPGFSADHLPTIDEQHQPSLAVQSQSLCKAVKRTSHVPCLFISCQNVCL